MNNNNNTICDSCGEEVNSRNISIVNRNMGVDPQEDNIKELCFNCHNIMLENNREYGKDFNKLNNL